jgi:hypothetical protein
MATANNIIVGGAKVYVGAAQATGLGFIDSAGWTALAAGASVTTGLGSYTEVGYTSNGIDLTIEPEYQDVQVDQILDAAILFKTSQKATFATTLAEATLANLARAVGQPVSDVTQSGGSLNLAGETETLPIKGGSLGSFPQEATVIAVANGPRVSNTALTGERVFEAYRAVSVEAVSIPVKRNETTQFPVSFRCLPQTDATGAYMKIADRLNS